MLVFRLHSPPEYNKIYLYHLMRSKPILFFLTVFTFLSSVHSYSQIRAVTEYGDSIYVYNNGTWSFELLEFGEVSPQMSNMNIRIDFDTLSTPFTVPEGSTKEVVSNSGQFLIRYNSELWNRIPPAQLNQDAEFAFKSKVSDIYCVVISEVTEIPPESLFRIAKTTMEETMGSKTSIANAEVRTVNGAEVTRGVLKLNYSGIDLTFDTYYYSDERGSVQFVTWSSGPIWETNYDMIHNLLNGFVVNK